MDQRPEDFLETGERTLHFRKVKRMLYMADIVISVTVAVLISVIYGFQIKPFFLPLDILLLAMGLVLLMVFIKSIAFKIFELKHSETSNTKLIITRMIIRRAFTAFVISLLLCLMFVPYVTGAFRDVSGGRWEGTISADTGKAETSFSSKDNLGTVWMKEVEIKLIGGESVKQVRFVLFSEGDNNMTWKPGALDIKNASVVIHLPYADGNHQYKILFELSQRQNVTVGYVLKGDVSAVYGLYGPVLAIIFIISSVPVIAYGESAKKKFIAGSIYEQM